MKLHIYILTLLMLFGIPLYSQDISVTIRKEYIENYINSLIDARAITIGKINGGYDDFDPDYSFVAHSLKSISLNTNGTLSMRIEGQLQFVMDWALDVDESVDILINNAPISYYLNEEGETIIRVSINAEVDGNSINSVSGEVYNRILGTAMFLNIVNSEDVSVNSAIDIPANIKYFSSVDPTVIDPNVRLLQIMQDGIKFNFVLKDGPRFVKVTNDVNGTINVGNIEHEENSVWKSYPSPKDFELNAGTTQKFGTLQDLLGATNGTNKYRKWIDKDGITIPEISPKRIQTIIPNVDPTYFAKFETAKHVQLKNIFDGSFSGSLLLNGVSVSNNYDVYEFSHPSNSYTVSSATPNNADYFLGWSDGNMNQTRSYVVNQDINLTANYKGHLRTGAPSQSNAINQTRLIKNPLNDSKLLVYESMGEVWLTGYSPASNTWFPEFRLSSGNGTAKNPSFSNVLYLGSYPNTTTYLTVAFVDNGKVMVQPMQLQADWGSFSIDYLHWNSSNNVRELLDLTSKTTVSVVGDSRPVVQLISSGSYGLKIWWANETTNQGLASGYLDLTTNLASGITAGTAQALSGMSNYTEVSSNSTDQYPVLITYPAAFGQPAKQLIYYLGAGYAAGKRIVEYNVSAGTKTVLSAPSGDYSYSTLSGAANYQSASYVLTATAVVPGQSTTTYNTNIYTKPTYYSGVSLSKVYTGKVNSSVSVQNMVYNGAPTYEVNLVTNSVWEKGTGGATLTQVTTGAQGVFVPANVEINQRPAMLTKSDASGPSKLQFYNGTTILNKGESVLYADVRSVRNYVTLNGQSKTAILDFAGALVEPVDSLENGSSICAVKLIAPDQNTIIVRQPDSIKTALAIDLIRNGISVRSYSSSLWDELSINSFEDVQDGDVLVFRLGFPVVSSWGYEIYDFNGTSLTKNGEETADAVKLKKQGDRGDAKNAERGEIFLFGYSRSLREPQCPEIKNTLKGWNFRIS